MSSGTHEQWYILSNILLNYFNFYCCLVDKNILIFMKPFRIMKISDLFQHPLISHCLDRKEE